MPVLPDHHDPVLVVQGDHGDGARVQQVLPVHRLAGRGLDIVLT